MAKFGKVGVHFRPGKVSFVLLKADSTTPFKTVGSVSTTAESVADGSLKEFWSTTILNQTTGRIALKLTAVAVPFARPASGTDTPTGDITVVLTNTDMTTTPITVKNFSFMNDP